MMKTAMDDGAEPGNICLQQRGVLTRVPEGAFWIRRKRQHDECLHRLPVQAVKRDDAAEHPSAMAKRAQCAPECAHLAGDGW
jgi:hypothetical protein